MTNSEVPSGIDANSASPAVTVPDRKLMEALYQIFNKATLDDQRKYYKTALTKYRKSAQQVNIIRAAFSLLTGLASAAAGFIVQSSYVAANGSCHATAGTVPPECGGIQVFVNFLLVLAVIAPALGGAFGTLADLYQWDRMVTIYDVSLENIEVADSRSPDPEMADEMYWYSLRAFVEGTLSVMRDETAQWGQLIRTPEQLDKYIEQARQRAEEVSNMESLTGTAEKLAGKGGQTAT
jgi:hypothetical protein